MSVRNLLCGLAAAAVYGLAASGGATAQTIITEWPGIALPSVPQTRAVTIDPQTTALLMLDLQNQNCGRRPRCLATIAEAKALLGQARARGVPVIHSIIPSTRITDIIADVAAAGDERFVQAGPNKFLGTDLATMLQEKNITIIIVLGTAANGAVLNTAAHAALLGISVILPVDGLSADNAYIEQYSIFHLANAPGIRGQVTLTTLRQIGF